MASTYLTRTNGTSTEQKIFTFSAWVKRSAISTSGDKVLMAEYTDSSNRMKLQFKDDDFFEVYQVDGGNVRTQVKTNRKFRDSNGWYHMLIVCDNTQGTNTNRVKIYVNGVQETSFSVSTYPFSSTIPNINQNSKTITIGNDDIGGSYFDGSMSHVHFIDGIAYTPSAFGETDATTGEWKAKTSPSVTYGTNGFLILKDGNGITDQSSNSNDFTLGGGTLTDLKDNPDNVFATFNPLARNASNTYANGNTTYDYANNFQKSTVSTLSTNDLKIYSEFKKLRNSTMHLGIAGDTFISDGRTVTDTSASHTYDIRGHTGTIALLSGSSDANIYADGSDTGSDVDFTTTTNDIVMIAFDPITKKIWFGKNGTWSNSGDPSNGTNPSYTYSGTATSDFCFAVGCEGSSSGGISANFGNGYFGTTAVASAGTNASGNGIFEYDVPTGYTALSTKGLNL